MSIIFKLISHGVAGFIGFALGIYMLPILIAPDAPNAAQVEQQMGTPLYKGQFVKDLAGSDFLHWGEGDLTLSATAVTFIGEVAPGPDYKLYMTPEFVETEADFLAIKDQSLQLGDVKTFSNFVVQVPQGVNPDSYRAVVLWCETFGEFISAARYR